MTCPLDPPTCTTLEFLKTAKKRDELISNDDIRKKFLDNLNVFWYNTNMKNEISTRISPEGLEIANAYLELGNVPAVSARLNVAEQDVSEFLAKREVKSYIDTVYLDTGYRNRFKLGSVLDDLIERKLEEAEETEMYSNKDLADLLQMAHKMRMDELKAQAEMEKAKASQIKTQNNVQINAEVPFGQGNYGELMKKLLKEK